MEKVSTREEIIEMLKNLHAVEVSARNRYKKEAEHQFIDEKFTKAIWIIKKDEDRHILYLEFLIKMLEASWFQTLIK